MDEPARLFDAYLKATTAAGHLLQSHVLMRCNSEVAAKERQKIALEELDRLAEMFGLELIPATEVKTR